MNRDELEGKPRIGKGKEKQAPELNQGSQLHDEAVIDEAARKTRDTTGAARRHVGQTITDVGDAVRPIVLNPLKLFISDERVWR